MQFNRPCWRALPFVFILVAPGVNADEADAFNFFVGGSVVRDDNIFRLSPGATPIAMTGSNERGDTIATTFVGGNFDKLIGRQRLKLDMTLNSAKFQRFSQLNNNGGALGAALNWTLSSDLTGNIGKTRRRALSDYRDLRVRVKNIVVTDNEYASADLRLRPSWHIDTTVSHATVSNSAVANHGADSTTDSYSIGFRYTPVTGNYIGLRNTWSKGEYPNQQFVAGSLVANGYDQNDAALEAAWTLTGSSRLSGVLAQTERKHQNVPERDFSGWTGNAAWDWSPTGKTALTVRLRREIGAQSDLLSSYVLTNAFSLTPSWTPTTKTSFRLNYERSKRDFLGDPVAALFYLPKRHDTLNILSLTATYLPMQCLQLSLSATREQRSSNYANIPYEDNNFMANAQLSF